MTSAGPICRISRALPLTRVTPFAGVIVRLRAFPSEERNSHFTRFPQRQPGRGSNGFPTFVSVGGSRHASLPAPRIAEGRRDLEEKMRSGCMP